MNEQTPCGPLQRIVRRQRGEFATLNQRGLEMVNGKCEMTVKLSTVRVMARVEGYAMVRHKGAMPFVVSERDLTPNAEFSGRGETT